MESGLVVYFVPFVNIIYTYIVKYHVLTDQGPAYEGNKAHIIRGLLRGLAQSPARKANQELLVQILRLPWLQYHHFAGT